MAFTSLDELRAAVGTDAGTSDWLAVDQKRIDLFAEATGDHQWIHVDTEKAAAGPFGTTIAHGYLTLSLLPVLIKDVYRVDGISMGINYGSNKVRFPATVPVGSRIRAGVELVDVLDAKLGKQLVTRATVEIEGAGKPACVAETLALLVP